MFADSQAEVEALFQGVVSMTEVRGLFRKVTGRGVQRALTHERSREWLVQLKVASVQTRKRFIELQAAALADLSVDDVGNVLIEDHGRGRLCWVHCTLCVEPVL